MVRKRSSAHSPLRSNLRRDEVAPARAPASNRLVLSTTPPSLTNYLLASDAFTSVPNDGVGVYFQSEIKVGPALGCRSQAM